MPSRRHVFNIWQVVYNSRDVIRLICRASFTTPLAVARYGGTLVIMHAHTRTQSIFLSGGLLEYPDRFVLLTMWTGVKVIRNTFQPPDLTVRSTGRRLTLLRSLTTCAPCGLREHHPHCTAVSPVSRTDLPPSTIILPLTLAPLTVHTC